MVLDQQNRLDVQGSGVLAIDYEVACRVRHGLAEEIGLYLKLSQRFSALDWRACLSPFELVVGSGKAREKADSAVFSAKRNDCQDNAAWIRTR